MAQADISSKKTKSLRISFEIIGGDIIHLMM